MNISILKLLKPFSKESKIKAIIEKNDTKSLYNLKEDELENLMINIWLYFVKKPFEDLNEVQKTLYFSMTLENVCQADSILNLNIKTYLIIFQQ